MTLECITKKPSVVVAAGASIETALLPYKLFHLRAHIPVDLHVALTPRSLDFVTVAALKAITGNEVYLHNTQFGDSGLPRHLILSSCKALVIYPATPRLVAECALGIVSCAVTRIFAFSDKHRVIMVPFIHPQMEKRLYLGHLQILSEVGCTILDQSPGTDSWQTVEERLSAQLGVPINVPSDTSLSLGQLS